MKYTLIVPTGGIGERAGAGLPKQYIKLNGKTILHWTLSKFKDFTDISQLLIPADDNYLDEITNSIPKEFEGRYKITEHGRTRFHSIFNSIKYIAEDTDYVMVHDAVRPFVSINLIETLMEKVNKYDAVVPYLTPTDTIKKIDPELNKAYVQRTLDREFLAAVQTPQIFNKEKFVKSYNYAQINQFRGTDDSSILEYSNIFPKLIFGDERNLKITSELDLELAKFLL